MASNSSHILSKAEIDTLVGLAYATEVFASPSYHDMNMTAVIDKMVEVNDTTSISPLLPKGQPPYEALRAIQAVLHTLPHNTNGNSQAIAYGVMTIIATLFVAVRIYSRKYITKRIRIEDWIAITAMVFVIGLTRSNILEAVQSFGHAGVHIWDLSVNEVRRLVLLFLPNELLFVLAHFFVKLTFIVFYHNLITSRKYRWCIKAVGVYVTIITFIWLFGTFGQCKPLDEWNHLLTTKCFNKLAAFTLNGVTYIIADVLILVLPIPAVLKLQLPRRDKITILVIFCAGAFVCIVSVVRLLKLREWLQGIDFTFEVNAHAPWVFVELDLSMIISCLPAVHKAIVQKRNEAGMGLPFPAVMTSGNFGQKKRKQRTRDTDIIAAAGVSDEVETNSKASNVEIKEESTAESLGDVREQV